MRRRRFFGVPIVLFGIALVGLISWITMGLWNALMPVIFNLPVIGFWQATGLLVLSRILFGRFGGGGGWMRKARFARGWHGLTPEERDRFRRAMGKDCPPSFRGDEAAGHML